MPKIPIILALIAAILFGAATPASKFLLDVFGTYQLAGFLYIGASLGVLPFILMQKAFSRPWKIDKKSGLFLLGSVIFGGLLGPVLFLFGLRFASAASVSLWLNLELAATALLGIILFRDHLTALGWYSFGIMPAAAILLSIGEEKTGLQGGMLVAAACFCWGFDNHFTAMITGISPAQTTFWKGAVAGTVNLTIGMVQRVTTTGIVMMTSIMITALMTPPTAFSIPIPTNIKRPSIHIHIGRIRTIDTIINKFLLLEISITISQKVRVVGSQMTGIR